MGGPTAGSDQHVVSRKHPEREHHASRDRGFDRLCAGSGPQRSRQLEPPARRPPLARPRPWMAWPTPPWPGHPPDHRLAARLATLPIIPFRPERRIRGALRRLRRWLAARRARLSPPPSILRRQPAELAARRVCRTRQLPARGGRPLPRRRIRQPRINQAPALPTRSATATEGGHHSHWSRAGNTSQPSTNEQTNAVGSTSTPPAAAPSSADSSATASSDANHYSYKHLLLRRKQRSVGDGFRAENKPI